MPTAYSHPDTQANFTQLASFIVTYSSQSWGAAVWMALYVEDAYSRTGRSPSSTYSAFHSRSPTRAVTTLDNPVESYPRLLCSTLQNTE
jgi:hypothetical protein